MKFFLSTCAALFLAVTTTASAEQRKLQTDISSTAWELLAAVNAARAANGATPLCLNAKLTAASQVQALDMAANGFLSTVGSWGSDPTSRALEQNFPTTGVTELVGAGYANAEHAVQEWMSSADLSVYLLGDYTYMGAGFGFNAAQLYQSFWVLDFDNSAMGESCA